MLIDEYKGIGQNEMAFGFILLNKINWNRYL